MARLGPFGPPPRLAMGVSGGPDSMALALLADDWAAARGGSVLAVIVDHGLRPDSGSEAAIVAARLGALGIAARICRLAVAPGPGVAERARAARHAALIGACREAGLTDLLLGHHADDQAETVLIRALSDTGLDGFAAMAARAHRRDVRVIRPMLRLPRAAARAMLSARGVAWVDDPSNRDAASLRSRMRDAGATGALARAARAAGVARAAAEGEAADWLGRHATIRPEGFALVPPGPMPRRALAGLLRMVAGADYSPAEDAVAALAAAPRAATLAGARIMPAGRWGSGWLIAREPAAMAGPVPCVAGALWDGRFRVLATVEGGWLGALGDDASGRMLPKAIARTLPAVRVGGAVVPSEVRFEPPDPATGVFITA